MVRPAADNPTELELKILKILWDHKSLHVREIRDILAALGRDIAHTSVITTLNTMFEKGYVRRKKIKNAFLFSSRVSEKQISRQMLGDVVAKVFNGSASALMLSLFEGHEIDKDELRELKLLINRELKEEQP